MSMNYETLKRCEHRSLSNENFCFNCGALKTDNVRYTTNFLALHLQALSIHLLR